MSYKRNYKRRSIKMSRWLRSFLTIGNYLHNFIIQELLFRLIADSMQDQIILLKRLEDDVFKYRWCLGETIKCTN